MESGSRGFAQGIQGIDAAEHRKGRPSEIDFINGSVVRWGERNKVATPVNQALVACVKGIELWVKQYAREP